MASARAAALVVASMLIGAASHVVWDSFTHAGRWGVRHVDWLAAMHGPLAGYRWAQYASGAAGAALIAVAAWHWWRRTPPAAGRGGGAARESVQRIPAAGPRTRQLAIAAIGLTACLGGFGGFAKAVLIDGSLRGAFYLAATWGGGAALAVAIVVAVALRPHAR